MTETTRGGHWRETDNEGGPTRIDPPTGRGAESLPHLAYSTYLGHVRGCDECQHRLYNCPDGKLLWSAYTDARDAAPRRCARCQRLTTEWTVQPNESDRGPVEVVWCTDATGCQGARAAVRPLLPSRIPRP